MIDYISGSLTELDPACAIVEAGGIGYEINITLRDYSELQGKSSARLYIHESIREDAHVLFGFLTKRSRSLFRLLIGVSGVGPGTARLILSSLSPDDLETVIATGQDSMLRAVKGIGGKTAQRIIVDLRDKIKTGDSTLSTQLPAAAESFEESLAALVTLGFSREASRKVLAKLYKENPGIGVEESIRKALKLL